MNLYDKIDNLITKNINNKINNINDINNIRIIFGKLVNNISDKNSTFFNTKITPDKINILVPLITSLFSINYKINKIYKLYSLDNILDVNINENGTKCTNVNSRNYIDNNILNNCIIICNKNINESLISFSNMKKYYNVEKYISIKWEIYNNCYIICNVNKDYITFELEINKINAINKIKNKINNFSKILSHLDVNSNEIN